jgi:hypothetical protein
MEMKIEISRLQEMLIENQQQQQLNEVNLKVAGATVSGAQNEDKVALKLDAELRLKVVEDEKSDLQKQIEEMETQYAKEKEEMLALIETLRQEQNLHISCVEERQRQHVMNETLDSGIPMREEDDCQPLNDSCPIHSIDTEEKNHQIQHGPMDYQEPSIVSEDEEDSANEWSHETELQERENVENKSPYKQEQRIEPGNQVAHCETEIKEAGMTQYVLA